MSEFLRCSSCPRRHFSTLIEAVKHVMSERGTGKGSGALHVQCCIQGCSKRVRKLRLHIRKAHKRHCHVKCPDCPGKFVEQNDLDNHRRNGCPRQKDITYRVTTPESLIETFFENVDFSDSSAVNNFITNELQLDEDIRDEVSRVVRNLYEHLQGTFGMNKLVKGGSFGKGTAVKDKADIDCVVFLNDVTTVKEHKRNLQTKKDALESCLRQSPFKDQITFEGQTPFAVKFKLYLNSSREFNIDLLPTFTTNLKPVQLYKEMIGCKMKDKGYYSAHFVRIQKKFIKKQPAIVKDLIRLVKYWRKTCIEDKSTCKTRLPSSYPLELITIDCWRKAGEPEKFDIRIGFKAVLEKLVNNCLINVRWYEHYDEALAKRAIKKMNMDESPPFVLDPANPTNNVCSASNAKGWQTVADVAKMTLQRQPLKDIIFNGKWQIEKA